MTNKKPRPLKISTQFFSFLRSENIKYCHWKSNIRLAEALAGETDLDLLVNLDDKERFVSALKRFNFITILSSPECTHSWVENALGIDLETGKLLHLHIHYRLILGEMYIKNHHLPIESFIFKHCKLISGVCVPIPEIELILLIIRSHMKLTKFAILRRLIIGKKHLYPIAIWDELYNLINICHSERFEKLVRNSGLPLSAEFMKKTFKVFSSNSVTRYDTIRIRKRIFQDLLRYNILPPFTSKFVYLWRQFKRNSLTNRIFSSNLCRLPAKGKTFALVGADGSGKSTIAEDISRWIGCIIKTNKTYFGGPKSGIYPKLLFFEWVLLQFLRRIEVKVLQNILEYMRQWFGIFRLLLAARYRRRMYLKAKKKIYKGDIIVCDRYPLPEFESMPIGLDGVEIRKTFGNRGSKIAELEEKTFSSIGQPDMVIVLQVSLPELRSRKPDVPPLEQHKLTVDCLTKLSERDGLVIINAQRTYNEVLLDVKKTIWRGISTK